MTIATAFRPHGTVDFEPFRPQRVKNKDKMEFTTLYYNLYNFTKFNINGNLRNVINKVCQHFI